jgi:catechol 2,3-dioxygenase-like lactoylglutathione lyase family enzyme
MKIKNIDHIVLTVRDIDVTVRFYESLLGMVAETSGAGRVSLRFGEQKINLHQQGQEFEPKAKRPTPGSGDLCLITETQVDLAMEQVRKEGVEILEGPVTRTGATGAIHSFYFRDPDGNLIEVAKYSC